MSKKILVCLVVAFVVAMVGVMQAYPLTDAEWTEADAGELMPFLRDGVMHRPIQNKSVADPIVNYRGFSLGVSQQGDGTYYLQAYKTVMLNGKEMRSIDASLYKLSPDKTYVYWPDGKITESHILWWPRTLTAAPYENFEMSDPTLPWGPALMYGQFVWAVLDPGYEFVAANKFPSAARAISFGKKFVNYVVDMKI